MSAAGLAVILCVACSILSTGCDDAPPGKDPKHPDAPSRNSAGRTPAAVASNEATKRLSSEARAAHFLKSLARLTPQEISKALKEPATLDLLMSLSPESVRSLYDDVLKSNAAKEDMDALNAAKFLMDTYLRELSVRSPEVLAAYVERADGLKIISPSLFLAKSSPELAFSTIERLLSNTGSKAGSGTALALTTTVTTIAQGDPKLAIQLINGSTLRDKKLMQEVIVGFAGGVNVENYNPSQLAALLAGFSSEMLDSYPEVAQVTHHFYNSPPSEVLPSFPLDGEPWQRAGAITYLEAAAFKGMNGDMYVTEFLESPEAGLLTDEERARLRHTLRKP